MPGCSHTHRGPKRVAKMKKAMSKTPLQFEPVHSKHSIEDFFLAVHFFRPLSESTHVQAVTRGRRLAADQNLPAEASQTGLAISVDLLSGITPHGMGSPGTYFRRFNTKGGVEEELRIERNLIGYRTGSYDRWKGIVDKLVVVVLPLVDLYSKEVPILASVILQYVDRFTIKKKSDVDWSELFCPNTQWVVSGMLHTQTAWHSHCGRFEESTTKQEDRRLVNVNVDVGEPTAMLGGEPMASLAILTLCSDTFIRPGATPVPFDPTTIASNLRARFDALHVRSKEILKEVLAEPYLKRIGMDKAPSI